MYVYIQSEPTLWTVGFYDPQGNWHSESDHNSTQAAAQRVQFLNGGQDKLHLLLMHIESRLNYIEEKFIAMEPRRSHLL